MSGRSSVSKKRRLPEFMKDHPELVEQEPVGQQHLKKLKKVGSNGVQS